MADDQNEEFDLNSLNDQELTEQVGDMLYRGYMLPFEVASILLLVAMVGAVVLAKKRI